MKVLGEERAKVRAWLHLGRAFLKIGQGRRRLWGKESRACGLGIPGQSQNWNLPQELVAWVSLGENNADRPVFMVLRTGSGPWAGESHAPLALEAHSSSPSLFLQKATDAGTHKKQ